jgi:hypothetical protein
MIVPCPSRIRWLGLSCLVVSGLTSCVSTTSEDLSSLAAKPALPFSVLITGGGFVDASAVEEVPSPLGRTYELPGPRVEAFRLARFVATLADAKVFVAMALDNGAAVGRDTIAATKAEVAPRVASLGATLDRARRDGHDFLLVVEKIIDGPIEYRGVNDRWPFTIAAWLFALGALIPDHTYESRAQLRITMRDAYSGRRVVEPILVESGPVDLNMFERCGFLGFAQSLIIPPFLTSTDPETITESVRAASIQRMLVSAVRRLKSAEVLAALDGSGPASIKILREGRGWKVSVLAKERISAVEIRLDGEPLDAARTEDFETRLLRSQEVAGDTGTYRYTAPWTIRGGRRLQILIQTDAARLSSVTQSLERK